MLIPSPQASFKRSCITTRNHLGPPYTRVRGQSLFPVFGSCMRNAQQPCLVKTIKHSIGAVEILDTHVFHVFRIAR